MDTLDLPVQVHTKIDVYDILGLETTNDQFFMDIHYNVYSNVYPKLLNYKNDTIDFFDFAKYPRIKPIYVGSDRLKITDRWYNKRWFGIVIGVAGTSTAIYLAGQL